MKRSCDRRCGFHRLDGGERLLASGHEVICLDNCRRARSATSSTCSASPGSSSSGTTWWSWSCSRWTRSTIWPRLASPVHYQFNPVKTVKTNVMGTINMLGLAKRWRDQASTSEVYGNLGGTPAGDALGNVNPIGVRSCYGMKASAWPKPR